MDAFDDLFAANARFAGGFENSGLTGTAARGLAVVTCMDSRIDPLGLLGLQPGDAKILRNAGARVTDDVQEGVIVATLGYWRSLNRSDGSVNSISSDAFCSLGRAPTFSDNLVQVTRVN